MTTSINASLPAEPLRVVVAEASRPERSRPLAPGAALRAERPGPGGPLPASESVTQAVDKVRDFVQVVRRDLEFSVDEETGRTIITVLDSVTGEVVRQIPPEEILAIAENLAEVQGILFEGKA